MKTDIYDLKEDAELVYVKATSFPEGVAAAHERLRQLMGGEIKGTYFGVSQPDRYGNIHYIAAVEKKEQPREIRNTDGVFNLKKGKYVSVLISDFAEQLDRSGEVFNYLIHLPEIDPQGCCVEMYLDEKNVRCMVRLQDSN
jgi:hypothetical protein